MCIFTPQGVIKLHTHKHVLSVSVRRPHIYAHSSEYYRCTEWLIDVGEIFKRYQLSSLKIVRRSITRNIPIRMVRARIEEIERKTTNDNLLKIENTFIAPRISYS